MRGATIRRATLDDLQAVTTLFDGYRQFYGRPTDVAGAKQFLRARLEARDSVILIAERGPDRLGFAQLYPSFSSISMRRLWILNDLFVDLSHRRGGVGQMLLAAAETFAREDGAKGLNLSTQRGNGPAKLLYESCGWTLDEEFDHYHYYFAT